MKTRVTLLSLLLAAGTLLSACGLPKAFGPAPSNTTSVAASKSGAPVQPGPIAQIGAPESGRAAGSVPATSTAARAAAQPNSGIPSLPPMAPVSRMVIKNGTLSIMVEDVEATLSQVDQLVQSVQGVIGSQTVRTQDGKVFANLTIQVPADNFETTMARLRDMRARGSQVVSDTVSGQDVTDQFVDLDAQYRNLQNTRDAYQGLLNKATSISDIITLTREIATIQTQMDQIKGRQNFLSHQAAMATINLALAPVGAPVNPPGPLPKPVQAAEQAWAALLAGLQGFAVVLIWLAILLPIPALVLVGGWFLYRKVASA